MCKVCGKCVVPWMECDDLIADYKRTVQSQSVCTVHVYTQTWAQHSLGKSRNLGISVNVPRLWPFRGWHFSSLKKNAIAEPKKAGQHGFLLMMLDLIANKAGLALYGIRSNMVKLVKLVLLE